LFLNINLCIKLFSSNYAPLFNRFLNDLKKFIGSWLPLTVQSCIIGNARKPLKGSILKIIMLIISIIYCILFFIGVAYYAGILSLRFFIGHYDSGGDPLNRYYLKWSTLVRRGIETIFETAVGFALFFCSVIPLIGLSTLLYKLNIDQISFFSTKLFIYGIPPVLGFLFTLFLIMKILWYVVQYTIKARIRKDEDSYTGLLKNSESAGQLYQFKDKRPPIRGFQIFREDYAFGKGSFLVFTLQGVFKYYGSEISCISKP